MSLDYTTKLGLMFPDNRYEQMKQDTEALVAPLSKFITHRMDSLSDREGEVLNVNNMIEEFKVTGLSMMEGLIRSKFGKNSQKYKEFFPAGTSAYRKAAKDQLDNMMEHLVNTLAKYASDFETSYIDNINTWYTGYKNARMAEKSKKNKVSTLKIVKTDVRTPLEKQMYKNLLLILADHIDNPEIVSDLFNFNVLFKHSAGKPNGNTASVFSVVAGPTATMEAGIRFEDETGLLFFNDSDVPVQVYTASSSTAECPATAITIQPGEEKTVKAYELGKAGNRYLFVKNPDAEAEANVEISQV